MNQPYFNPFAPHFNADPYSTYDRLRSEAPIHRSRLGMWVALKYADVQFILGDKRFGKPGRQYLQDLVEKHGPDILQEPTILATTHWLESQNPPEHTRLRRLVLKALTSARIEAMRPRIESRTHALLDAALPNGKMDAIRDFAFPLPAMVICDLIGIPEEDRGLFLSQQSIPNELLDPMPLSPSEREEASRRLKYIYDYFDGLAAKRRAAPEEDLISALIQVRDDDGNSLTREELLANLFLIFGAGHETTEHLIGNIILWLHNSPEHLAQLRAEPSLIPKAVEELLRYDTSMQMTSRIALQDIVVNGVLIRKNERILLLLGSANRDPEAYDAPDKIDFRRKQPPLSSFGGGFHYCLGARLALFEAEIATRIFLEKIPHFTIERPDELEWLDTTNLHGLKSLPIAWEP